MKRIPERRSGVRIVTLKNAAWVLGGLIASFLLFSMYNELRPRNTSREQLYERGRGDAAPAAERNAARTTDEQPVSDETFARGSSGPPLARSPRPSPAAAPIARREPERPVTLEGSRHRGERVRIVGGADGVRVEATPAQDVTTETAVPPDRF